MPLPGTQPPPAICAFIVVGLATLTACAAATAAAQSQRAPSGSQSDSHQPGSRDIFADDPPFRPSTPKARTTPGEGTSRPPGAASADVTIPSSTLEDGCAPGLYWRGTLCVHPPPTCGGWNGVTCVRTLSDRDEDNDAAERDRK